MGWLVSELGLSPYKVLSFSYSFRPDEVYSSRWKLVFNESTVLFQRKPTSSNVTNRMRNLHKFILENYGIGSLRLLRDWEKYQLRQCDFKNHRIFMLRCIHSELVPVSIRLKSTLKSEMARKILRMAEKQLLQTRLKSINSLLDNNAKQLELTRSKIASILTPPNYQQCQEFIEKIKEKRFIKVRERQVRKLNNLINKKEGGITWQSSQVSPAARAFPPGK